MSEPKDPAIKLFGMTIPVLELPPGAPPLLLPIASDDDDDNNTVTNQEPASTSSNSLPEVNTESDGEDREADKDPFSGKQEDAGLAVTEELANPDTSSSVGENPKTSVEKDSSPSRTSKPDEQNEKINSQEKTLKKPDKILPCPRCNSMETKFCYFNNYNVNQPRHFCKNCQRYWTAGGTMRNVPVGAGRRKNKNSSHHRQIAVPEPFQNARVEVPNGVHHPPLKLNGTVLTFGSDKPLCESMASVLNLTDKTRNGQKPEELRIPSSYGSGESDEHSNGSSATASSLKEEAEKFEPQGQVLQNCQGFYPTQIPCFPGAPLPYPWNPAQWSSPVSPPTFLPPSFPIPFYPPTPYWGCAVPGGWNVPWLPQPPSPKPTTLSSGPNSPTLGKHSREDHMTKPSNSAEGGQQKENNGERCLWIPKTLRIDDPGEAAKSSIWATLGIKNDKSDSVDGGLFKAFKSKGDEKNPISQPSPVLQVNPAALSRSVKFHENS